MSKIAVIGAGPAGIAATVQLVRQGHEVQVFEHGRIGGTLWNAGMIENYPGFPGGITGRHLARLMEQQLYDYIDSIISKKVETIIKANAGYEIFNEVFDGIIICTGTVAKKAGFPGENELAASKLLFYGIKNIEHWHGEKDVAIIGGGEASIDMALSIFEAGMNPTIIHRSEPKGIKSLLDTAKAEENITWLQGNITSGRVHENKVVLALENEEKAFDMMIIAVGREKCLPMFENINRNNLPGDFCIAGDAARGGLGQTSMAVGDGVEMAIKMDKNLEAEK